MGKHKSPVFVVELGNNIYVSMFSGKRYFVKTLTEDWARAQLPQKIIENLDSVIIGPHNLLTGEIIRVTGRTSDGVLIDTIINNKTKTIKTSYINTNQNVVENVL